MDKVSEVVQGDRFSLQGNGDLVLAIVQRIVVDLLMILLPFAFQHGTNGEGSRTKSQRDAKKQRIVKIAQSAGLLVSTILKHTLDQSLLSLVHGKEKSVKSTGTAQGMIQHRPKNLVNVCTRRLKTAAHHSGTTSKKIMDNERRLLNYLEELSMTNSEQGSNANGTMELVPVYILNGHRGNMKVRVPYIVAAAHLALLRAPLIISEHMALCQNCPDIYGTMS